MLLEIRQDGVAVVTLNRPNNRNSMTRELLGAFRNCISQIKVLPGQLRTVPLCPAMLPTVPLCPASCPQCLCVQPCCAQCLCARPAAHSAFACLCCPQCIFLPMLRSYLCLPMLRSYCCLPMMCSLLLVAYAVLPAAMLTLAPGG